MADASGVVGNEICDDAFDNDGDGRTDCSDVDCSGVGSCPVCGDVQAPQAQPLALPDGVNSGAHCTTDADCSGGTPNCVSTECHASYNSTLHFVGFPNNALLDDPSKLISVCVNIEHSWLRDLQMEIITPPDTMGVLHKIVLDKWHARSGAEIYLGGANDADGASNPVAGTGADYCWTMAGAVPMIDGNGVAGPTMTVPSTGPFGGTAQELKPGDYAAMDPWTGFAGVNLNGDWTMRVTDLWGEDNGFMFHWSIKFDPTLVNDCAGPIIL